MNYLTELWIRYRNFPGYQSFLYGMGIRDFEELDVLDESLQNILDESKEYYEDIELPKIKEALDLMKSDIGEDAIREIRVQSMKEELSLTESILNGANARYEERYRMGMPMNVRLVLLDMAEPEKLERKIKRLRNSLNILENWDKIKEGEITEDQIMTARDYPIDRLIQLDSRGFCKCPFHNDTNPSMSLWKKKNLLHCFSCMHTSDTIDLIMKLNNRGFVDAVKFLISI